MSTDVDSGDSAPAPGRGGGDSPPGAGARRLSTASTSSTSSACLPHTHSSRSLRSTPSSSAVGASASTHTSSMLASFSALSLGSATSGTSAVSHNEDFTGASARTVAMLVMAVGCTFCGLGWFLLLAGVGEVPGALPALAYALCVSGTIAHYKLTGNSAALIHSQLFLIFTMPLSMHIMLGGFHNSSVVVLWSTLAPVGAMLFHSDLLFRKYSAAYIFMMIVALLTDENLFPARVPELPQWVLTSFYFLNLVFPMATLATAVFFFNRAMETERQRISMVSHLSILASEQGQTLKSFCKLATEEAGDVLRLEQLTLVCVEENEFDDDVDVTEFKTDPEPSAVFQYVRSGYEDVTPMETIRKRILRLHKMREPRQCEAIIEVVDPTTMCAWAWLYAKRDARTLRYTHKVDPEMRAVLRLVAGLLSQRVSSSKMQTLMEKEMEMANELAASKTKFLAVMSHEMRTPLQGIVGMNEMMLESSLSDDQYEYASHIRASCGLLVSIVSSVLDQSKIEAGKMELEEIEFDVVSMLETVAHLVEGRVSQVEGVEIGFIVDSDVPAVCAGDPMRLQQVLVNLCGNAAKFTSSGTIIVRIGVADRIPEVGQVRLRVSVEDSGIGIREEDIGKLFRDYSQASSSTSRKFGGTGLGLSICKGLVELMGGCIWVESDYGHGSTFTFEVVVGEVAEKGMTQTPKISAPVCLLSRCAALHTLVDTANRSGTMEWTHSYKADEAWEGDVLGNADIAAVIVDENALTDELLAKVTSHGKKCVLLARGVVESGRKEVLRDMGVVGLLSLPLRPSVFAQINSIVMGTQRTTVRERNDSGAQYVAAVVSKHALVVDDDRTTRLLTSSALKRLGFDVQQAADGDDALRIVAESARPFDVVLTDHHMDRMHGPEFVQEMREHEAAHSRARVPVLVLSGDDDAASVFGAHVDAVLAKPFTKATLVEQVHTLLEQ